MAFFGSARRFPKPNWCRMVAEMHNNWFLLFNDWASWAVFPAINILLHAYKGKLKLLQMTTEWLTRATHIPNLYQYTTRSRLSMLCKWLTCTIFLSCTLQNCCNSLHRDLKQINWKFTPKVQIYYWTTHQACECIVNYWC